MTNRQIHGVPPVTTNGRFRHRTATLTGGPFDGGTARIYPDVGRTGAEPATIHLCLGTHWPHWQPLGWAIYTRQPNGGYTWTATVDQDTPAKPPGVHAEASNAAPGAPDPNPGVTEEYDRDVIGDRTTPWERAPQPAWGHLDLTAVEAAGRQIAATSYTVADVEANLTRWRKQP